MLNIQSEVSTEMQDEAHLAPQGKSPSIFVPFNRLRMNPENRLKSHSKTSVVQRAAEIMEMGLLQNMVVSPQEEDGFFMIQAGNGRYLSVEFNINKGLLDETYPIECRVNTDVSTDAIKLAENSNRQNLHPVEEFKSFSRLVDEEGKTIKEVANAYGRTQKFVQQRLKLAGLSPTILTALLEDKIDVSIAEAFTLSDDLERQESAWDSVKHQSWLRPETVKRLLLEGSMLTTDKRFTFVGTTAYRKAGGIVTTDLFGEHSTVENPEIVVALVDKKLKLVTDKLVDENYSFIVSSFEPNYEEHPEALTKTLASKATKAAKTKLSKATEAYDNLTQLEQDDVSYEKEAQLEAEVEKANKDYDDSLSHTQEDKLRSGICVFVSPKDNKITVRRGVISLLQIEAIAKAEKTASADGGDSDADSAVQTTGLSQALTSDLGAYKGLAIKVALLGNPTIAKDLVLFNLLDGISSTYSTCGAELAISSHDYITRSSKDDLAEYSGLDALYEGRSALPTVDVLDTREVRFAAFCALSSAEKDKLFCLIASNTLTPQSIFCSPIIDVVASELSVDYREHWAPTKANYFGRIGFDLLKTHAEELCGTEWLGNRSSLTKSKLADELATLFTNADLRPENSNEKFDTFLPEIMNP